MRGKHIHQRVLSCLSLAELSECTRRKFGCVMIDPQSNVIISDGYNGAVRGCGRLCGGEVCDRERAQIKSGTALEVGCVHAEQNAIYNAVRRGAAVRGSWLFVNGEPCLLCAKAIAQVGVRVVVCIGGVYDTRGVDALRAAGVLVETLPHDATQEDCDALLRAIEGAKE